jgi:hypothetical protein
LQVICRWSGPALGFAVPICRSCGPSWRLSFHLPAAPAVSWLSVPVCGKKCLVWSVGVPLESGMRCARAPADGPGWPTPLGQARELPWRRSAGPRRRRGRRVSRATSLRLAQASSPASRSGPKRRPRLPLGAQQARRAGTANVSRATARESVCGWVLPDHTNRKRQVLSPARRNHAFGGAASGTLSNHGASRHRAPLATPLPLRGETIDVAASRRLPSWRRWRTRDDAQLDATDRPATPAGGTELRRPIMRPPVGLPARAL